MSSGFCPQLRPDSCVAACCAMLLHHRRPPPDESILVTHDRLHASLTTPPGPGLGDARELIGAAFYWLDASEDASFTLLEARVTQTWCAVVVFGGPWTHDLRHRKLTRPHGRLSNDPTSAHPRHAVVLTAWGPTSISVHDPWFDMFSQPVRAEAAWLRRAWTGELAYFPADP